MSIELPFHLSFVEFAQKVATSAYEGESKTLKCALLCKLQELESTAPTAGASPQDADWVILQYKTILALGILIAGSKTDIPTQKAMLDDTLLHVATNEKEFSAWTRDLALCELCYVDQFLLGSPKNDVESSNLRSYLYDKMYTLLETRRWCPPIRDYIAAMGKMTERAETIEGPDVYFIGSVKGGVGKSLTAAALLYALGKGKNGSCALIDLDVSGPTAQYHFNVPAITMALSAIPDGPDSKDIMGQDEWQYASSYNVFAASRGSFDERQTIAGTCIYRVLDELDGKYAIVPLPDSPTFCGLIEHRWRGAIGQSDAVIAIDSMIAAVAKAGYHNVVLDVGFGLSGVHSMLLRWITNKYRTHGVIISTPRVADLVSSLYEASWMAGYGEYRWEGPLVHLVNGWTPANGDYRDLLARLVNESIDKSLRSSIYKQWEKTDSATQLIAFRLWSVLYLLAIPTMFESSRLLIEALPFDAELRDILSVSSGAVDLGEAKLIRLMDMERDWTKKLLTYLNIS